MATKFFTNKNDNSLLKKLEGIFQHMDVHHFDAVVGFFRASGYFKILPFIKDVKYVRILVGIDIDQLVWKAFANGLEFRENEGVTRERYLSELQKDIQNADYTNEVESGMLQFIHDLIEGKVQIKIHPSKKLHSKIYIFRQKEEHEHAGYGSVITGSSNLTESGLERNFEFNVELRDHDDVVFAHQIFEELWLEGIELTAPSVHELKKKSYLNEEFTPFELYIKFLIEYFGTSIDYDPDSAKDLPSNYTRLRYQVDAVNQGIDKLRRYNGFFLADVVGLGKTIVSIMIAKMFALQNGLRTSVLIVHPPALKNSWERTINDFNLPFRVEFISNGSLHKIKYPKNYDLIIVDEAHKFRSDTAERFDQLQKLCKTERRNPGSDGDKTKKVILVTATPLNNKPDDIRNLVLLFQDGRNTTIDGVPNLISFFAPLTLQFNRLKNNPNHLAALKGIKDIYNEIREQVISPLTIRRTRTDIKNNKEYYADLTKQGLDFPDIEKPTPIFYELNDELNELFVKSMNVIQNQQEGLKYYRYQALRFLKEPYKSKYNRPDMLSESLAFIIKTLLVKRLDSSFHSFIVSLGNYHRANKAMMKMRENNRIHVAPSLEVTQYIINGEEDKLIEKLNKLKETDPSVETYQADDFESEFWDGLEHDMELVEALLDQWKKWEKQNEDPKLKAFIEHLGGGELQMSHFKSKKLVIFSEYTTTTKYLKKELLAAGFKKVLAVDAGNLKESLSKIERNFDPRLALEMQEDDFDILITTEVLAEGVNLHRSNTIINYDTPWNSTRLMQRIGRVNRIGTAADKIHIINFYPTEQANSQIDLYKKALIKLQAFHTALGEDSQIYSSEEEFGTFGLFDKKVDEEERDERLQLLLMLRDFKKKNPEWFKQIKDMPKRARTARTKKILKDGTIIYLKNKRRDGFYFVRGEDEVEEINFVEAAQIFKAFQKELGFALPEFHHEQVNASIGLFENEQFRLKQEEETAKKFGPNDKKAIAYIQALLDSPVFNEEEKLVLRKVKRALQTGRFQKLQRDINNFKKGAQKAGLNLATIADQLMEILLKYPLPDFENNQQTAKAVLNGKPNIILSESFID